MYNMIFFLLWGFYLIIYYHFEENQQNLCPTFPCTWIFTCSSQAGSLSTPLPLSSDPASGAVPRGSCPHPSDAGDIVVVAFTSSPRCDLCSGGAPTAGEVKVVRMLEVAPDCGVCRYLSADVRWWLGAVSEWWVQFERTVVSRVEVAGEAAVVRWRPKCPLVVSSPHNSPHCSRSAF